MYEKDKDLTEKHELAPCTMGRCCNAVKFDELESQLENMYEFIEDCSVSHHETRYKYKARVLISKLKRKGCLND